MAKINWKKKGTIRLEEALEIKKAEELRIVEEKNKAISKLVTLQAITLASSLSDEQVLEIKFLYPQWDTLVGQSIDPTTTPYVMYEDDLYIVSQAHTVQQDWTPVASPSLFAKKLANPNGEPSLWVQPDSTNGYKKGERVVFKGKIYESLIDNNVWSPAAYPAGWKLIP